MVNTMYVDENPISDIDLYCAAYPTITTAEQDIEHVEVRGRHGTLTKKYGFKDIPYSIEFWLLGNIPFRKAFRLAKMTFLYAKKIHFTDDEEVFYKVKTAEIGEAEKEVIKFGRFTVNFTLEPFQYEFNNDVLPINKGDIITNTGYETEPIITLHATGSGNLTINNQTVGIKDINGEIIIDCMLKNAYRKKTGSIENLNNHMVGDFPILKNGENKINYDGSITKVEILKNIRWL